MAGRLVLAFVAAVLVVAAGPGLQGPFPTRAESCPDSPLTVPELLALWEAGGKEAVNPAGMVNHPGRRCYGTRTIVVTGYVDDPGAGGDESPWHVEPYWLVDFGLYLYPTSEGRPSYTYYSIAYRSSLGNLQERYLHRWVTVRAHFDDAAARSCHAETTVADPSTVELPDPEELVRSCRSILVLEQISTLAGADTAAAPVVQRPSVPGNDGLERLLLPIAAIAGVLAWVGRRRLVR